MVDQRSNGNRIPPGQGYPPATFTSINSTTVPGNFSAVMQVHTQHFTNLPTVTTATADAYTSLWYNPQQNYNMDPVVNTTNMGSYQNQHAHDIPTTTWASSQSLVALPSSTNFPQPTSSGDRADSISSSTNTLVEGNGDRNKGLAALHAGASAHSRSPSLGSPQQASPFSMTTSQASSPVLPSPSQMESNSITSHAADNGPDDDTEIGGLHHEPRPLQRRSNRQETQARERRLMGDPSPPPEEAQPGTTASTRGGARGGRQPRVSRRQPHNVIERRYREGLNKEMEELRSILSEVYTGRDFILTRNSPSSYTEPFTGSTRVSSLIAAAAISGTQGHQNFGIGPKTSKAVAIRAAKHVIHDYRAEIQRLQSSITSLQAQAHEGEQERAMLEASIARMDRELNDYRSGRC